LIINKTSLGSCEVPHKMLARSVQLFWSLLNTNKVKTYTQTSKVYINIIHTGFQGASRPSSISIGTFSLCIHCKTKQTKKFADFIIKNCVDFQNLMKIELCWRQIFYHPFTSLGSCEVPDKIWDRSVQPFWRLLNTNKVETNTQTNQVYYIYIVRWGKMIFKGGWGEQK